MKQFIFLITNFIATNLLIAQSPNFDWVKGIGGTSNEEGRSIAVDGSGNVYTTGWFMGTCDFDPGKANSNLTSAGDSDIFVSKLNASGNFVWAKKIGGSFSDGGRGIAVNASGDIFITGNFNGSVDFDPGAGSTILTSSGQDGFILKLNSSGAFGWAMQFGSNGKDMGRSIDFDATGNLLVTGFFSGIADFDPTTAIVNLIAAGGTDIFIASYNSAGNFISAYSMGGSMDDIGASITIDNSGNIYTTGSFSGTSDFDPSVSNSYAMTSAGSYDIFVSKLDSSGKFIWAKQFVGSDYDAGNSIKAGEDGNVYSTGFFSGTADFDPGAATFNLTSAGYNDIYISKLDANGNFIWAKGIGGIRPDGGASLEIGNSGNLYITGWFNNTVDFDPGPGTFNITVPNVWYLDIFILKLNSAGNLLWVKNFGGNTDDVGWAIALDETGGIYTTGSFQMRSEFHTGPGKSSLTAVGGKDCFVHKLSQTGGSTPGATGLNKQEYSYEVNIYPNPNNGKFIISSNKEKNYRIINNLGQVVLTVATNSSNNYKIEVEGLKGGIYFITDADNETMIHEKIVIVN